MHARLLISVCTQCVCVCVCVCVCATDHLGLGLSGDGIEGEAVSEVGIGQNGGQVSVQVHSNAFLHTAPQPGSCTQKTARQGGSCTQKTARQGGSCTQ